MIRAISKNFIGKADSISGFRLVSYAFFALIRHLSAFYPKSHAFFLFFLGESLTPMSTPLG